MLRPVEEVHVERYQLIPKPVLSVQLEDGTMLRLVLEHPEQFFLEVVNGVGAWLKESGTLPEVS
jgi:hypothetical protein